MILDRAIINALCELMGEGAGAFFLRVRDVLVKNYGFTPDEANAIVNAYLAQAPNCCINIAHITGDEKMTVDGFKVVRFSIVQAIDDILNDEMMKCVLISRISEYVKNSFSSDLQEAVKEINEDIHGEPIESVECSDNELRIKLKRDAEFIAYVLAHIRADNPKLVSKQDNEYVFVRE